MLELRRATIPVALLGLWAVLPLAAAQAAEKAAGAVGSETVSGGTWAVVPTQSASTPPPTGALTLTATNNAAQYFKLVNTGTEPLVATTYVVAISGGTKTALTLTACSVAWNQGGAGSCSGTTTAIKTWSIQVPTPTADVAGGTAVASAAVPGAANTTLFIRGTPASVPGGGATFTITTSVSSASSRQLGSALTTNA